MPTEDTHIEGTCKGCKKRIIFMRTLANKLVPCNPESVGPEDTLYNRYKHIAHFATCPKADKFRTHHHRVRTVKNAPLTAEQIQAEREKIQAENQKRLAKDKRPFIVNNNFPITSYRYALLNRCAAQGMGYEELTSKDNRELTEWLSENETVYTAGIQESINLFNNENV